MKKQKMTAYVAAVILMISMTGAVLNGSAQDLHSVFGYLYINDQRASSGVEVRLSFGNEQITDETNSNGYYQIDFTGHDNQIGEFLVIYQTESLIPSDNATISIDEISSINGDGLIFVRDLHVTPTGGPTNAPPFKPHTPNPSNGATNVGYYVDLWWIGGDPNPGDIVTYDVYFGTTNPPSKVSITLEEHYDPGALSPLTHYYWKIVATDDHGSMTIGDLWVFTTTSHTNRAPDKPYSPTPENGASEVSTSPELSVMVSDPDGDSLAVTFYNAANNAIIGSDLVPNGTRASTPWSGRASGTTYQWYAIVNDTELQTTSDIWSFTTKSSGGGGGGGGGGGNEQPIANASKGEPYHAFVYEIITFDGSLSYDPDGTIFSYSWSFGDGNQGTGKNSTHAYKNAGTYTVTLTVTDDQGATGVDTTTATILPSANRPPTKPTIAGLPIGNKNVMYDYTATSTDPDNDTIRYTFTWGDQTSDPTESELLASGTQYTARHQWTVAGKYTITVTVTDDKNASSDSSTLTVLIDAVDIDSIGYLTDDNGDGIWDTFHNSTSGITTAVEQDADGNYLIDTNGDGIWDLIYDPITKTTRKYVPPVEGSTNNTGLMILGGMLALALIAFLALLLIGKKKKGPGKPSQPVTPPAETPPPASQTTTKKKQSTKKTGKK